MIRRKYANMRIYEDNIDFADVENTITYSLSAKNLENNLNKREEELCNKIADLEKKLAEKEKEIEYQENMKILAVENQNKKAIEQLEKVKEFVIGNCGLEPAEGKTRIEISKYIKQQINELKGKVEDVKD